LRRGFIVLGSTVRGKSKGEGERGTLLKTILSTFAALLSALLLYASFPPLEMGFLAWIALIPILIAMHYARYLGAFLFAFLMGMVFAALHICWINVVPGLPIAAFLSIALYGGMFFGFFGLFLNIVTLRTRWPQFLIAPTLWIAIEYLRSNLFFLAIPLGLIGYSQHDNIPLIQVASFTSVYGISFLIVLVNGALAEGLLWLLNRRKPTTIKPASPLTIISSIAGSLGIVLVLHLWGNHQVRMFDRNKKEILTASLIQGNIPQNEKWDSAFRKKIMARYRELTLKASQDNPDMIIWPETATPGYIKHDLFVYLSVRDLMRGIGIPILLGSGSSGKVTREGKKIYRLVNSAFLIDQRGRVLSSYDKMRLLPFGEHLPLEGRFPWPRWLVPKHETSIPGKYATVFQAPKGRFGVVICWENLFSDLFRKFVNGGAQFMVNITNEAHFGKTAAPYQLAAISVFRAVENRVSLLRVANTGISCLIDPIGRIKGKVMDEEGNDIFVSGVLTVSVPGPTGPTFYTKHGDVFVKVFTMVVIFFILSALVPKRTLRSLKISRSG
jgi:apolipoprotein N-acyltransferase